MRLLAELDVFPTFLDLIHAFGYRSDDVGDDFQSYCHASKDVSVRGESRTIQGMITSTEPSVEADVLGRDLFQHSLPGTQWSTYGKPLVNPAHRSLPPVPVVREPSCVDYCAAIGGIPRADM